MLLSMQAKHEKAGMAPPPADQQCPKNRSSFSSYKISLVWVCALLLLVLPNCIVSQSIIKTLPGYSGNLPFKLETGYVAVGELDDVQLFYYFFESERNPEKDPLVLWLTGGPGCSGFSSLIYEIGPLSFNYANFSGKPTFVLNPYSLTKIANIIFLDAPVGAGYSYSKTWKGANISDTTSAADTYSFIRKWIMDHPKFNTNPLYVGGDSYSGIVVPIITQHIVNGNEAGLEPEMNLQGYILGNPVTNTNNDVNSRVEYAHRVALLSDELYESTKANCHGQYVYVDSSNALCLDDLKVVTQCLEKIFTAQILEPVCSTLSPKPNILKWDRSALEENSIDLLSLPQLPELWCREYNYLLSYIWANSENVQNALHVREGTVKEWIRCNGKIPYTYDVATSIDYHRNLTKKNVRALIYSGDHDMVIPYVSTLAWIESLNLTISDDWKPWFVDGQVAGYTMKYTNKIYRLTFATVKGGGHTAPEYKPMQTLAMVDRWLAYYPL